MRRQRWLSSFAIAALSSGCVTIPNSESCSAAGSLARGAVCAESLTGKTRDMTFEEYLEFLEPNEKRAGAVCQSAEDAGKVKTALEQACRMLGKRCTYEIQQAIAGSVQP